MSDIRFYVSLDDLNDAREEFYLQGIMQGEAKVEKLRQADSKNWISIVKNLRELCEDIGATDDAINACWPENYGAIYEKAKL